LQQVEYDIMVDFLYNIDFKRPHTQVLFFIIFSYLYLPWDKGCSLTLRCSLLKWYFLTFILVALTSMGAYKFPWQYDCSDLEACCMVTLKIILCLILRHFPWFYRSKALVALRWQYTVIGWCFLHRQGEIICSLWFMVSCSRLNAL